MKGKDLIEAIQRHGLEEHDFPICGEDGIFTGYITLAEAGKKYKIPISKIRLMVRDNRLSVVKILNSELLCESEADDILSEYAKNMTSNTKIWKERRNNEFARSRAN